MVVKETVNKSSSILKACFTALIIYIALHISVPAYADATITPDTWYDAAGTCATNVEYKYDSTNSELTFRAKSIDSSASIDNKSEFRNIMKSVASQYSCDFKIKISGENGKIVAESELCYGLFYFDGNNHLVEVDLSGLDTTFVTQMSQMFFNCNNLQSINLNGITTSSVTSMQLMFAGCSSLTSIDVSGFDTSSVTDMDSMFSYCSSLTSLDLRSFNISNVTCLDSFLCDAERLETVVVSGDWAIPAGASTFGMVANCNSIVGKNGTTYDSSHTDGAYARIDCAPENPGYFWGEISGTAGSENESLERNFDREWIDELINKIIAIGESKKPGTIKIQANFALPKEVIEVLMKYPNVTLAYMCNYEVNGKMTYHSFPIKGSAAYILRDDIPWYGPKCLVMMYE